MKKWILFLAVVLMSSGYFAHATYFTGNKDRIGTFLGGEDPFPWGDVAELPNQMGGVWEVRDTEDGAYFIIEDGWNRQTGKVDIDIHLFDPCTFELTAVGKGKIEENMLKTTLNYAHEKFSVSLEFQAYYPKNQGPNQAVQMVLRVMEPVEPGAKKHMYKYFPVKKIGMLEMVCKCEAR